MICHMLAPFLASLELSEDLAAEVAAHSREIEEQRRFTSLIIDSLPVGLYVVDRDYRIQFWNRKRETGTQGMRRDEAVGRRVFDVLTRQPAGQLKAEFDPSSRPGRSSRTSWRTCGGEARYFRLTKIPMRLDGDAISHVITIGEDVTESRAMQSRILQSEKLAAIGQLAAGVMHEINNPLATIGACVAAIEGGLERPDRRPGRCASISSIIDREVHRCTRIVDGLLDFSRPKASARRRVPLDRRWWTRPCCCSSTTSASSGSWSTGELAPELPPTVGNGEQLIQALMALMLNAVDAMEQAGRLTVRTGQGRGTMK